MDRALKLPGGSRSKGIHLRNPVKNKASAVGTHRRIQLSEEASTAIVTSRAKTPKDRVLIIKALSRHFVFTSLTQESRNSFIDQMKLFTILPNEQVFQQSQPGNLFFIIASGAVQVIINGHCVKELGQGDSFGELALLHDAPRSATIRSLEKTTLWGLERTVFRSAVEGMNAEYYQDTKEFIENVPLFKCLTRAEKDSLIASVSTLKFRAHENIVNEGDSGDLFYLITEGEVSCLRGGKEISVMAAGDFFGEQSLLYDVPRTASIRATTNVKCLAIGRVRLTRVLGDHLQPILYQNSINISFERSKILSFDKAQVKLIAANSTVKSYSNNEVVIRAGTAKCKALYIVVGGTLLENYRIVASTFSCLGEQQISRDDSTEVYEYDVIAHSHAEVAEVEKSQLERYIGSSVESALTLTNTVSILKRVQLFRRLPTEKLKAVAVALQLAKFVDGDVIVEQESAGDCFFLINEGMVNIVKNNVHVRTIVKHDYFGERSLLFNDTRSASVIASGEVSCWILHSSEFNQIIDENIRIQLIKRIELQDDSITLEDLTGVLELGKGVFGNVFMVVHKTSGRYYALKAVPRAKIDAFEVHNNLLLERKIMLELDHSLIVKLIKTFKDKRRIYFLMEFVMGIDLFDVLRQLGLVSERQSRFYTACLLEILQHLHERDIIYRDLKPENIMVDDEGYPKLIDFGTAKIISGRTFTLLGTPHYMAPEVITGHGYGISADYWSVGIILYEMLCGGVPFGEDEEDPYKIYQIILEGRLRYPEMFTSRSSVRSLIEQLLEKNSGIRTTGTVESIKGHLWFEGFYWEGIFTRELKVPYLPNIPNLSKAVQVALVKDRGIEEFISKEEKKDRAPARKGRVKAPEDWDSDF